MTFCTLTNHLIVGLTCFPQGPAPERSVSVQPGGQPLTTIIKPVHAIQPDGGEQTIPNTNITPISGVPENVLGEGAKPVSKKLNAYTITPIEFAKKTAVVHAEKLEEKSKESTAIVLENLPDKHASPLETETGKAATTAPKKSLQITPTKGQDHNGGSNESKIPPDKTISSKNNGDEDQEQLKKITHETADQEKPLKSSNRNENLRLMTVSGLVNTTINELEAFSKEVTEKWNERREKISWLGEAMEVLQTYNVKITETEKYSNCTTNDRKKYQDSKNSLKSIMDGCERALKRKDWHELQEKTSKILSEIRAVEEDYDAQISQISKDEHFDARKLVIDDNVKRKLRELNTEAIENDFSKLRDDALRIDEEHYEKCINIKETDAKGTAIISEIRQAIMKIYDCV